MGLDKGDIMAEAQWDFVIIGAGTAGLTAAQYGARSCLKTLVIESELCGGQALNIFALENYPGLYPAINGNDFIETMKKQAFDFGAKLEKRKLISIGKKENLFYLKSDTDTITCHALLIATGATHRQLGVPGEKEFYAHGVSYCATCDGPFFRKKRVLVVGGGDSACDEANYLSSLTSQITLVHRRDTLRAQKAVAERVLTNPNIKVLFNTILKEIKGDTKVTGVLLQDTVTKEEKFMETDGVFIFTGMDPQTQLINTLPKDATGYIITDENMATCIPGLYCAGDVRAKPFRQLITAASDGAIAAHCAEKYIREVLKEANK